MADAKEKPAPIPWWPIILLIFIAAVFAVAASSSPSSGGQVNLEYFFRLIYELIYGGAGSVDYTALSAMAARIWVWITVIGYVLAAAALGVIVYGLVRLFELRRREDEFYGALIAAPESAEHNPRWERIQELVGGMSPSEWREAIIEADIMLDDMLSKQGYVGAGVAEKLREVEPSDFTTLRDAWDAHGVRNRIAHDGSAFDLSDTLARRTVARYEAVFREFGAI